MLGSFRNRRAGVLICVLLAALVIGLAGFGIGAGSGISSQNVARVGDRPGHRRRLRPRHAAGAARAQRSRSAARSPWPRRASTASTAWCWRASSTTPPSTTRPSGSASPPATTPCAPRSPRPPPSTAPTAQFDRETYTDALDRARPAPGRVRGTAPPRVHPRPPRRRRPVRRHPARHRRADRPRLPRRARSFDWLRLDAGLLPEPDPRPHRRRPRRRARRPRRRPLHPPRDPADRLRQHHPRRPRRRDRDPRGRAPRRLRRRDRPLPDPGAPRARPHRLRHRRRGRRAAKARLDAGETDFDAARRRARPASPRTSTRASSPPTRLAARGPRRRLRPPTPPASSARSPTPLGPALFRINAIMAPKTTALRGGQGRPRRGPRGSTRRNKRIPDDTAHIRGPDRRRRHAGGDRLGDA